MLGALVVLADCGGSDLTLPRTATPASITKIGGENLTGSAGAPLGEPLVVKVVDQDGVPVANQGVAFETDPGATGARVTPAETNTNSDGVAQTDWVLGAPSGTQIVTARVVGADIEPVTFAASVLPAEARLIERLSGHEQNGAVGTELAEPLVVLVTDEFGNPVPDVAVEWSTENGRVDPGSSWTDSDGRASTTWTLGSSTGPQAATAASAGLEGSPLEFAAIAVAGRPTRLVLVSGNNQTAAPGQQLPQPLVVRLLDEDGNAVPNQAVSWVVGVGGGSVDALNSNTNEQGEAQMRWTLGPSPGLNTLNAVVSTVGLVSFRATASGSGGGGGGGGGGGSAPSRLEFVVQPSDAEEDEDISPPVQVAVLDQSGNRVTTGEFEIKLELTGNDDGRLRGDEKEKTRSGVAVFDDLEVDREGEYRLRATSDGLPAVESNTFRIHDD